METIGKEGHSGLQSRYSCLCVGCSWTSLNPKPETLAWLHSPEKEAKANVCGNISGSEVKDEG